MPQITWQAGHRPVLEQLGQQRDGLRFDLRRKCALLDLGDDDGADINISYVVELCQQVVDGRL